jgi:hypothetical protein
MPSTRKFFVTTITVKVLSEDTPVVTDVELLDLNEQTQAGDYVMLSQDGFQEQVTPARMAELLDEAGSEPGFFALDHEGNSTDDHARLEES